MGIFQCHVSFQGYIDPVGTGMVFGGQTIHLSHIATFLNNLGIFGCNHLLYIKIQRKIINHPTTIWQNNSSITYILPLPQAFFVALEAGIFFVLVPPFSPSPSPRGWGPVCSLAPNRPVRNHTFMTCKTPVRKLNIAWPEPFEVKNGETGAVKVSYYLEDHPN